MRTVAAALLVAMAFTACGGSDDPASDGSEKLTVEARDFEFDRDLEVAAGSAVTVELRNLGSLEHTWTLLRADVAITTAADIADGFILAEARADAAKADTVSFVAPGPGSYQIVCAIPGHLEAGMESTLGVFG